MSVAAGLVHRRAKLYLFMGVVFGVLQMSSGPVYGQMPTVDGSQNPAAKSGAEEFEAATIKPGATGPEGYRHLSLSISPGGRIQITNWTLKQLVCAAYNLSYWQVKGGDGWIDTDQYDVEAKPPDPSDGVITYNVHHDNWSLEDPKLHAMLQTLLKDRFQLKVHLATKDGPVYLLERDDRELALTPAGHTRQAKGLGWVGSPASDGKVLVNATMPALAAYLSGYVFHQTVIDKTGLEGAYDFQSKTVATAEDYQTIDTSRILPAVKEMGLKLTRTTGLVTELVIDSAARPSAN
jgi:uncharacterized protein (TIGR03435 family)